MRINKGLLVNLFPVSMGKSRCGKNSYSDNSVQAREAAEASNWRLKLQLTVPSQLESGLTDKQRCHPSSLCFHCCCGEKNAMSGKFVGREQLEEKDDPVIMSCSLVGVTH